MENDYLQRAWALIEASNPQAAEEQAREAISLNPENFESFLCLASCWYQLAQYGEALEAARESLRLSPGSDSTLHLIGWIHLALQQDIGAQRAARAAIAIDPDDASHHALMATIHAFFERPRKALRSADAALSLAPQEATALHARGDALLQLGRYREGAVLHRDALGLAPTSDTSLTRYGEAMQKFGDLPAAESAYRDALRNNAENQHARDLLHRVNGAARREYYRGERLKEIGETVWMLWATPHVLGIAMGVVFTFLGYWKFIWKPFIDGDDSIMAPVTVLFFGFWLAPALVVANMRTAMQFTAHEQVDDPPPWYFDSLLPLVSALVGLACLLWLILERDRSACIVAATSAAMAISAAISLSLGKPLSPWSAVKHVWVVVGPLHLIATAFALCAYTLGNDFPLSGTTAEKLALYPVPVLLLPIAVAVVWDWIEA